MVYMGRNKNGQTKRSVRGRDLRESFGQASSFLVVIYLPSVQFSSLSVPHHASSDRG